MDINIKQNTVELGKAAGTAAAQLIHEAITANGHANIILCSSQYFFQLLFDLVFQIGWFP